MNTINFAASDEDSQLINKIVERAKKLADKYHVEYDKVDIAMDITACHLNGTPLKLQALLDADDFNFSHDVFGIRRHIDRDTGKVGGFFLPRFADTSALEASHD
jgi:hypothetical protein